MLGRNKQQKLSPKQYDLIFSIQPIVDSHREILEDDEVIAVLKDIAVEITVKKDQELKPNQLAFKNAFREALEAHRADLTESELIQILTGFAVGVAMNQRKPLAGKPAKKIYEGEDEKENVNTKQDSK